MELTRRRRFFSFLFFFLSFLSFLLSFLFFSLLILSDFFLKYWKLKIGKLDLGSFVIVRIKKISFSLISWSRRSGIWLRKSRSSFWGDLLGFFGDFVCWENHHLKKFCGEDMSRRYGRLEILLNKSRKEFILKIQTLEFKILNSNEEMGFESTLALYQNWCRMEADF